MPRKWKRRVGVWTDYKESFEGLVAPAINQNENPRRAQAALGGLVVSYGVLFLLMLVLLNYITFINRLNLPVSKLIPDFLDSSIKKVNVSLLFSLDFLKTYSIVVILPLGIPRLEVITSHCNKMLNEDSNEQSHFNGDEGEEYGLI